eukprot:scaffold98835_cov72-Phaeocystis_antarctica.AAC.1
MQPCTAQRGGRASVTKLATLASGERARRRPRADDEDSDCSKAHAALHRGQRWKRQRYEAGDARLKRASTATA